MSKISMNARRYIARGRGLALLTILLLPLRRPAGEWRDTFVVLVPMSYGSAAGKF